jgi:hypothetical protein
MTVPVGWPVAPLPFEDVDRAAAPFGQARMPPAPAYVGRQVGTVPVPLSRGGGDIAAFANTCRHEATSCWRTARHRVVEQWNAVPCLDVHFGRFPAHRAEIPAGQRLRTHSAGPPDHGPCGTTVCGVPTERRRQLRSAGRVGRRHDGPGRRHGNHVPGRKIRWPALAGRRPRTSRLPGAVPRPAALAAPGLCDGAPPVPRNAGHDATWAEEFWDRTNRQDWAACESVQRGLASPQCRPGPFASNEDASHRWVAMIARAYLGAPPWARRQARNHEDALRMGEGQH